MYIIIISAVYTLQILACWCPQIYHLVILWSVLRTTRPRLSPLLLFRQEKTRNFLYSNFHRLLTLFGDCTLRHRPLRSTILQLITGDLIYYYPRVRQQVICSNPTGFKERPTNNVRSEVKRPLTPTRTHSGQLK